MGRYFIELAYNGADYHGWQRQLNGISVQEELEKALSALLREPVQVTGAGRTDAGVHAMYMVAHFDTLAPVDKDRKLNSELNRFLPDGIVVYSVMEVNADAHSRFSAISRKYEYHVITRKNPFARGLATPLHYLPDVELMNLAASCLTGVHDFSSFTKMHGGSKTNVCEVTMAAWQTRGTRLVFTIEANRFTRNMVRAIVGTLLDVGRAKISVQTFRQILEGRSRALAGNSVPPQGLYLVDINYPEEVFVSKLDKQISRLL